MADSTRIRSRDDYVIGWICALDCEFVAARAVLNEEHPALPLPSTDTNCYLYGSISRHNVVIARLPSGTYGTNVASRVAEQMRSSFRRLRGRLMVGIGGGVPGNADIRLGDVVVSDPGPAYDAVIQFDMGKSHEGDRWPERTYTLNKPPADMRSAVAALKLDHLFNQHSLAEQLRAVLLKYPTQLAEYAHQGVENDNLYEANYNHQGGNSCDRCAELMRVKRSERLSSDPQVFHGTIASGNQVVKDSVTRDHWRDREGVMCFEMEAAGLMDEFPCLVVRGICDYADSHKNKIWQPYAALVAAVYAKQLLEKFPSAEDEHESPVIAGQTNGRRTLESPSPHNIPQPLIGRDRVECIQRSLNFSFSEEREQQIEQVHARTYEWLLKGPCDETDDARGCGFVEWLQSDIQNFYWISGKAGSGKSTLMKHIAKDPRLLQYLKSWSKDQSLVLASFYFHDRGKSPLQKSQVGLLRSILYQIFNQAHDLVPRAMEDIWNLPEWQTGANPMEAFDWTIADLKSAFRLALQESGETFRIYLNIDGLDEYSPPDAISENESTVNGDGKTAQQKAMGHTEIAKLFVEAARYNHVKICVSSRQLQRFFDAFKGFPHLKLEELTSDDIKTYVFGKLDVQNSISVIACRPAEEMNRLVEKIVSRAAGVFLWVKLVVDQLLDSLYDRDTFTEMEAELEHIPTELVGPEGLFMRMIRNIKPAHLQTLFKLVRLLLTAAKGPPSVVLLAFAEDPDASYGSNIREPRNASTEPYRLSEWMIERIRVRSAGLLEARSTVRTESSDVETTGYTSYGFNCQHYDKGDGSVKVLLHDHGNLNTYPVVHFMHQTVREFFQDPSTWRQMESMLPTSAIKPTTSTAGRTWVPDVALLKATVEGIKAFPEAGECHFSRETIFWEKVNDALFYARQAELRSNSEHDIEAPLDELDAIGIRRFQAERFFELRRLAGVDAQHWSMLEPPIYPMLSSDSILLLAASNGLSRYVMKKFIDEERYGSISHDMKRKLLAAAGDWQAGSSNPGKYDRLGSLYFRQSDSTLLEFLLGRGADPNGGVNTGRTSVRRSPWEIVLTVHWSGRSPRHAGPMPQSIDDACSKWIKNLLLLIDHGALVKRPYLTRWRDVPSSISWNRLVMSGDGKNPTSCVAFSALYFAAHALCHLPAERRHLMRLFHGHGSRFVQGEKRELHHLFKVPVDELAQYESCIVAYVGPRRFRVQPVDIQNDTITGPPDVLPPSFDYSKIIDVPDNYESYEIVYDEEQPESPSRSVASPFRDDGYDTSDQASKRRRLE